MVALCCWAVRVEEHELNKCLFFIHDSWVENIIGTENRIKHIPISSGTSPYLFLYFKTSLPDLILVNGIYSENHPFPLHFPIMLSTGFHGKT